MNTDRELLKKLLLGMRAAYRAGDNAMGYARANLAVSEREPAHNTTVATLVAYDLQSGTYVERAQRDPEFHAKWCAQIAAVLSPLLAASREQARVLEVGCGEATTLAGVLASLQSYEARGYGFDLAWSRIHVAKGWLATQNVDATLFVADLFSIPLADDSIDIVYTSHSLEPNGGRERQAIEELLRVARTHVVLVEPAYELANDDARRRMDHHGYVKGLRAAAESAGAKVLVHRLLDHTPNALNPSGLLVLEKPNAKRNATALSDAPWRCPLTAAPLEIRPDAFVAKEVGLVYPILRGVPLLRPEHAVVASLFESVQP